jgi:hypothetical protein
VDIALSYLEQFMKFIPEKFGKGCGRDSSIPQSISPPKRGSWDKPQWAKILAPCLSDEAVRIAYN